MDPETFKTLVETEPDRQVVRMVRPLSSGMARGRTLAELRALSNESPPQRRELQFGHRLGPSVDFETLSAWEARKGVTLPAIARDLLRAFDGVHLWANLETGRAYAGIAPLEEWTSARDGYFGVREGDPLWAESNVQISYNADCSDALVLDCNTGEIFRVEVSGPDKDSRFARSLGELLEQLWATRLPPRGG